jgi:hypothetical protein
MSRWTKFRFALYEIPTTNMEAAVFLSNARLHLLATNPNNISAREVLNEASDMINRHWFDEKQEVAA